jgi:hypothetical protein
VGGEGKRQVKLKGRVENSLKTGGAKKPLLRFLPACQAVRHAIKGH